VIVFRTDASTRIGGGHVMRCLALAARLRATGAQVSFVCREHPGQLTDTISDRWGFDVQRLPRNLGRALRTQRAEVDDFWKDDATQTAAAILSQFKRVDWLVVDHYALDARWEETLRPLTRNLMVIDDLADRLHDCDLLVDQNHYSNLESRYDGLVPASCGSLLGPTYALLRPEFAAARSRLQPHDGTVRRMHISFGATDPTRQTMVALEAISHMCLKDVMVNVVIGQQNADCERILASASSLDGVTCHVDSQEMAPLMARADFAIGSGGVSTNERMCVGLPAAITATSPLQETSARDVDAIGAHHYLGRASDLDPTAYSHAISKFLATPGRLRAMREAGMRLADGLGTQRVVARLLEA